MSERLRSNIVGASFGALALAKLRGNEVKNGKIWGVTEALWDKGAEIHRLEIKPDHHCSWHLHRHKANAFFVFEGVLYIERKKDYGLTDTTELRPGDFTVVPAPEPHRFRTGPEGARALELYWPMPLSDDIVREDNGGMNEVAETWNGKGIPPAIRRGELPPMARRGERSPAIPPGKRVPRRAC